MKKILFILACTVMLVNSCKKLGQERAIAENGIKPYDFLSDKKYKNLIIDIIHDPGYAPANETIGQLKSFLSARLNKPGGIEVMVREINGNGKDALSLSEITDIEKKYRTHYSQGTIVAAFVYLCNADYAGNSNGAKILGVHYGSTSVALFGKTIRSVSGGFAKPPYTIVESTVAQHEFGHVLGLVDNGSPMVTAHIDSSNGRHCSNSKCLMYYLAETSDIVKNLLGGAIPELDSDCLADLKSNGGK